MISDTGTDLNKLLESALLKEIRLSTTSGANVFMAYGNDIHSYFGQNTQCLYSRDGVQTPWSNTIPTGVPTPWSQNDGTTGDCLPLQEERLSTIPQIGFSASNKVQAKIQENKTTAAERILANISCSFCNHKGHVWDECRIRRNTPICDRCNKSGHNRDQCSEGNRSNSYSNNTYKETRKCFKCGRPGHISANCYSRGKDTTQRTYPAIPTTLENKPTCTCCGKYGHTNNQCFKNRNQENQQQQRPGNLLGSSQCPVIGTPTPINKQTRTNTLTRKTKKTLTAKWKRKQRRMTR